MNDATENVRPAPVICSTSVMVAVALSAGPARLETVPVSVATIRPDGMFVTGSVNVATASLNSVFDPVVTSRVTENSR